MSQLVTGEAVALDVRTAGLPSRLLAGTIDGLIQGLLFMGLVLLLVVTHADHNEAIAAALSIAAYVLCALGYPVLLETLLKGRTPGKAALGLRVVRDDAGPIGFRQAFVRGLIGFFVEKPGVTLFSGAVVCSLLRQDSKRIGDVAAGTIVVQERVVSTQGPPVQMPPPLRAWAMTLDLARLPDDLALSARTFLARSAKLTDAARAELGQRLAAAVGAVVTPPPPPGTPEWAYLSAVLAERRRRAEARPAPAAVPPAAVAPITPAAPGAGAGPGSPAPAGVSAPPPVADGFAAPF